MTTLPAWLRSAHRFLGQRAFYALWFASALAVALVLARWGRTHASPYRWLTWNLILAWVPYLASLWADSLGIRCLAELRRLVAPGALWLAFLPNAPYIFTDFMHVSLRRNDGWLFWYDIVTLAVFAWTGCALGVVSLRVMRGIVARTAGRIAGGLFVLASVGLCGIGIYLGRFQRWNSWDLLINPDDLIRAVAPWFRHPLHYTHPWAMCLLFALFFLVSYLTLGIAQPLAAPQADSR